MSAEFQKYTRLYSYIHEYQSILYNYYSKNGISYLVTYYNINKDETVWDNNKMYGGSYEKIGNLSGIKWNKYLSLPVYWSEEISTVFDANEHGYVKENETNIIIPSTYNIIPYPNDIIKLEQEYLRENNDIYPIFIVSGIEIYPNTDKRYWKLKIKSFQSKTTTELDNQVENIYSFFEYTKKIYTVPYSSFLSKLMDKSKNIKNKLDELYDKNSGLYFI